ncbi:MAG: alpha/beta hydrolase domain-containing protein, partial [Planctomycetota bacterium]|nr:alpha/beta hydrolase domain-containing protein [Planctomycetota bacterium]
MRRSRLTLLICLLSVILPGRFLRSEVVGLDIDVREDVLDGKLFGDAGAYEKLAGTIHFAFDPDNPYNARIVDLALAPRNEAGLVEAHANFMVLKPKDPNKSNGVAYIEVSNRGGKATLRYFQRATGRLQDGDPVEASHFGDGLLMNRGVTIIWVGWQWDVPDRPGLLRLNVPIARNPDGSSITGLIRSDWVLREPTQTLGISHRNHIAYKVFDPTDQATLLTQRTSRNGSRIGLPMDFWHFAVREEGQWKSDDTHISLETEFKPDLIYELVYRTSEPRVVGLGLAAIRDIAAYAKYDETCPFPASHAIAFGVSQTGRFLRQFLHQGFNTDEANRKVYDGMLIHTAGAGRGSFNHRFGQPSRDAHRYSAFFYPTDIFPFTSRTQLDKDLGIEDGLFANAFDEAHLPKV